MERKKKEIQLKVPVKAGENGKIFGGVSAKEIADLLKENYKIEVDKKKIDLKYIANTMGIVLIAVRV